MGSANYGAFLQHAQDWQDLQRKQAIAQNQDATLNIASMLRTGKHPDTGEALTPAEIMELTKHHGELTAQSADLWNQRQDPGKMGKNVSAATGVAMPEGLGHRITDLLRLTKAPVQPSATMVNANAKGLVTPGNIPIWNRPTIDNGDGTHSTEYSTTFTDDNGHEVLLPTVVNGKFLTPDGKKPAEKSEEEKAMFQQAWQNYEQTGQHLGIFKNGATSEAYAGALHNRGDAQPNVKTPQQQMADLQSISQQYRTQPGQNEAQAGNAILQSKLHAIEADPKLTPEEKDDARRKVYGVEMHPDLKLYTLPNGTKQWFDARRPDLLPDGTVAASAETSDTRLRDDFASFQKENPDYKGTFLQWKSEQGAKGRTVAKPETLDKQYQDILVKEQSGRPLSPDEKARSAAWKIWNKETKIDPGIARAAAFGADRYVPVVSLTNPEKVVMMRAGDAAKAEAGTPASIAFQTDKAVTKAFTAGKPADTLNYFNTARDHLSILHQAAVALNNHDTQLFNSLGNKFAAATGSSAPTNFETVKAAVAGEISKTFKGAGASDTEIAVIGSTINSVMSPDQLSGAVDYYERLMDSKLSSLKAQYDAGKQGKPNFPSDVDDIVKAFKKGK